MRVALCDDGSLAFWSDCGHLFAPLVAPLRSAGHDVVLLDAASCGLPRLITAFSRERDALPLLSSTRIAHRLIAEPCDLCLFPESTGLAHATLMARACGELPAATRIVLWRTGEDGAHLVGDWSGQGMRPVTIAAMRRFCAEACDGTIPERGAAFHEGGASFAATLLLSSRDGPIRDFRFCGPLTRAGGVVAFIEAIEGLARRGRGTIGKVTFVGAFDEGGGGGVDREWLGRRASGWAFRFFVEITRSLSTAVSRLSTSGEATVVTGVGPAFLERLPPPARERLAVRALSERERLDPVALRDLLSRDLAEMPSSGRDEGAVGRAAASALLAAAGMVVASLPVSEVAGLSVCILHHERPRLLAEALASILSQADGRIPLEILVVDNASSSAEAAATLSRAAEDPRVDILSLTTPHPYSSALNLAAERATQPFLVFLDDDNLLAPGGLARLARACAGGRFDVVTSALDLFEEDAAEPTSRMTFIGPASTAGLFVNAFGDNCMAFWREAFARIGGYLQRDAAYPSADWILLCRAQAAGLRIGVLQEPAFLYRRSLHKSDMHWQPWDQPVVRALLLENYGACFDAIDVARLAQAMALELCV